MAEVLDQHAIDVLLEMVGGDPGFVDELADAWLSETPALLDAMAEAIAGGDAAALVRPAHTLKGSSASLGAMAVSGTSASLEVRARSGSLDGAEAIVAALRAVYDETVVALEAARQRRWAAS